MASGNNNQVLNNNNNNVPSPSSTDNEKTSESVDSSSPPLASEVQSQEISRNEAGVETGLRLELSEQDKYKIYEDMTLDELKEERNRVLKEMGMLKNKIESMHLAAKDVMGDLLEQIEHALNQIKRNIASGSGQEKVSTPPPAAMQSHSGEVVLGLSATEGVIEVLLERIENSLNQIKRNLASGQLQANVELFNKTREDLIKIINELNDKDLMGLLPSLRIKLDEFDPTLPKKDN